MDVVPPPPGPQSSYWVGELASVPRDLRGAARLPFQGVLRGEVLSCRSSKGTTFMVLRDARRPVSVQVRLSQEIAAQRGDFVEVEGGLDVEPKNAPLGTSLVWHGTRCIHRGEAERFARRRVVIDELAQQTEGTIRKIGALGRRRRVWVVTGQHSKAWYDIQNSAKGDGWLSLTHVPCEIKKPESIATALESISARQSEVDTVVVARGGGDWFELDVFEDPIVARALSTTACRIPTVLAVGHADDKPISGRLVGYTCATPWGSIPTIQDASSNDFRTKRSAAQAAEARSLGYRLRLLRATLLRRLRPVWMGLILIVAVYLGWWLRGQVGG